MNAHLWHHRVLCYQWIQAFSESWCGRCGVRLENIGPQPGEGLNFVIGDWWAREASRECERMTFRMELVNNERTGYIWNAHDNQCMPHSGCYINRFPWNVEHFVHKLCVNQVAFRLSMTRQKVKTRTPTQRIDCRHYTNRHPTTRRTQFGAMCFQLVYECWCEIHRSVAECERMLVFDDDNVTCKTARPKVG